MSGQLKYSIVSYKRLSILNFLLLLHLQDILRNSLCMHCSDYSSSLCPYLRGPDWMWWLAREVKGRKVIVSSFPLCNYLPTHIIYFLRLFGTYDNTMSMCYQAEEPDPQLERMSDLLKSDSVFMVFWSSSLWFSFSHSIYPPSTYKPVRSALLVKKKKR